MAAYKIRDWDYYEPREKAGGTKGPLKYAQWRVHGFNLTHGYRKLADVAGPHLMAAMGTFSKLIELAADQPREFRDGTIRRHREGPPATIEDIAYNTLSPAEQVRRSLEFLMHPDVRWVEEAPDQEDTAGDCGRLREIAGEIPPRCAGKVPPNETKPKPKQRLRHNEEGPGEENSSSCSDSGQTTSSEPHAGVISSTVGRLAMAFGVSPPQRRTDPSPRAKQERSDWTTLNRIVQHVVTAADQAAAKSQAGPLLELAAEATDKASPKDSPIAWFVARCKKQWAGLPLGNGCPSREGGEE